MNSTQINESPRFKMHGEQQVEPDRQQTLQGLFLGLQDACGSTSLSPSPCRPLSLARSAFQNHERVSHPSPVRLEGTGQTEKSLACQHSLPLSLHVFLSQGLGISAGLRVNRMAESLGRFEGLSDLPKAPCMRVGVSERVPKKQTLASAFTYCSA